MTSKYRRFLPKGSLYTWVAGALLLAIMGLMLFSWIGSMYGYDVQNLLSMDGMRWILRDSLYKLQEICPFLGLLCICMGCGVVVQSGWWHAFVMLITGKWNVLSVKERWGLQISMGVGVLFCLLITYGALSPDDNLLSVTGRLYDSPLLEGIGLWLTVGLHLLGVTHGWISGIFRKAQEVVDAGLYGAHATLKYMVLLFLLVHFITLCGYVFQIELYYATIIK